MTIYNGSRYQNQPIVQVTLPDGETDATVYGPVLPQVSSTYTNYLLKPGDRFDTLAYTYLGDPTLWWQIANMNPEVFYPDQLTPGTWIRIPAATTVIS